MELITIIMIIAFISKMIKKSENEQDRIKKNMTSQNVWDQVAGQVKNGQTQSRQYSSSQNEQWKRAARENIEQARRRAEKKFREVEAEVLGEIHQKNTYQMPKQNVRTTPAYEQITLQQAAQQQRTTQRTQKNVAYQQSVQHRQQENRSAMQQVHAGRMEARNTTILQRAVKNAEEDKVDVTLHTMEAEHNHSERVAPAEHYHPEDEIPENMLGTIEDLMVKGYEGNLCFERDFVGEAMDMISRFTAPSELPDFSKDDVA